MFDLAWWMLRALRFVAFSRLANVLGWCFLAEREREKEKAREKEKEKERKRKEKEAVRGCRIALLLGALRSGWGFGASLGPLLRHFSRMFKHDSFMVESLCGASFERMWDWRLINGRSHYVM